MKVLFYKMDINELLWCEKHYDVHVYRMHLICNQCGIASRNTLVSPSAYRGPLKLGCKPFHEHSDKIRVVTTNLLPRISYWFKQSRDGKHYLVSVSESPSGKFAYLEKNWFKQATADNITQELYKQFGIEWTNARAMSSGTPSTTEQTSVVNTVNT